MVTFSTTRQKEIESMKRQKFNIELNIAHWHKEIYSVQNQDLQTGVCFTFFLFSPRDLLCYIAQL